MGSPVGSAHSYCSDMNGRGDTEASKTSVETRVCVRVGVRGDIAAVRTHGNTPHTASSSPLALRTSPSVLHTRPALGRYPEGRIGPPGFE